MLNNPLHDCELSTCDIGPRSVYAPYGCTHLREALLDIFTQSSTFSKTKSASQILSTDDG